MNSVKTAETVQDHIEEGLKAHQAGQLQDAEKHYHKALESDPNNADAYHLLGMLAYDIRNYDVARELVLHAVDLNDSVPLFYNNLGNIFAQLNELEAAHDCFNKAISLDPGYPDAHYNLANILLQLEEEEQAISEYKRAIELDNNFTQAHINLGGVYLDQGNLHNALVLFGKAVELEPQNPRARRELSNTLIAHALQDQDKGDITAAIEWLDRACKADSRNSEAFQHLAQLHYQNGHISRAKQAYLEGLQDNPLNADMYYNLGVLARQENNPSEAVGRFQQAITVDKQHSGAHYNLANTYKELGQWDEALKHYDLAIEADKDYWPSYVNKAIVQQGLGEFEQSLATLQTADALHPNDFQIHNNMGMTLQSLRRADEAIAHYDQAIALEPANPEPYWNKSLALLLKGDYTQGWQLYEKRWELKNQKLGTKPSFAQAQWRGESLKGKTILLTSEQGLGDSIQFIRYAQPLSELGAKVIVQCPNSLISLFKTVPGITTVHGPDDTLPTFDTYSPLMSVPKNIGTTLKTIPQSVPYCEIDSAKIEDWSDRLRTVTGFRVGIAWAGNPRRHDVDNNLIDSRRSCSLKDFKTLSTVPGVTLISLQKGEASMQTIVDNGGVNIVDETNALNDFSDTGALIENLDLVISVDTSVVHLAGALNKPVWVLSRFDGCWRWLLERDDSPWYPSLRLFRQTTPGDWQSLMTEVGHALSQYIKQTR